MEHLSKEGREAGAEWVKSKVGGSEVGERCWGSEHEERG